MRFAPWESTPRRSASTRLSATIAAWSFGTPRAPRSRSSWPRSTGSSITTTPDASTVTARAASSRRVAGDRRAVQRTLLAAGVADDRVLDAAVVPDQQVTDVPLVSPGVLEPLELCVQVR